MQKDSEMDVSHMKITSTTQKKKHNAENDAAGTECNGRKKGDLKNAKDRKHRLRCGQHTGFRRVGSSQDETWHVHRKYIEEGTQPSRI
jgi:hypothetical protein